MDENHISSDVARTLRNIRTSMGEYCIKQLFSTITPFFETGNSFKLLPMGANYFHLEQFVKVLENHDNHTRRVPLSVTIFIVNVRILRNGSYANA